MNRHFHTLQKHFKENPLAASDGVLDNPPTAPASAPQQLRRRSNRKGKGTRALSKGLEKMKKATTACQTGRKKRVTRHNLKRKLAHSRDSSSLSDDTMDLTNFNVTLNKKGYRIPEEPTPGSRFEDDVPPQLPFRYTAYGYPPSDQFDAKWQSSVCSSGRIIL